ncbi:MAG: DUF4173 domain-containing protein, partial [Nocardiopsis sp. BM-2018]
MSAEETGTEETHRPVRNRRADDDAGEPAVPESTPEEPAEDDTGHYALKYPGALAEQPSRPRTPLPAAPVWLPLAVLGA